MRPGMTQDSWHITGCEVVVIQAQNNLFRIPCAAFAWSIQKNSNSKCYRLLHRYKTRVYTETPAVSDTREESQSSCLKRNSSTAIISPKPKPFQKRKSLLTNAHHHILSRNQQSQQAVNGPAVTGMGRFAGSKTTPNKVFCDFGVAWAEWAHALPKKLSNTVIRDVVFPVFPH